MQSTQTLEEWMSIEQRGQKVQEKKGKKKRKILVKTWSDNDPSSSDEESIMESRANLCLREKDDKVCNDDFDTYDSL